MGDDRSSLRRDGFTFKQFFVAHDRCAMKVGTDGVLLGAWAPLRHAARALDIGCGSGLIALMLAQRSGGNTAIDAVELDSIACAQAVENMGASPWRERLRAFNADIADFARDAVANYQLIVSNPPYFAPGMACGTEQRRRARHTATLTHETLLRCARDLLAPDGLFCVVLPVQVAEAFLALAARQSWHRHNRVDVSAYRARPPQRVLLALSRRQGDCLTERLVIREPDERYTPEYRGLTADFYLSM